MKQYALLQFLIIATLGYIEAYLFTFIDLPDDYNYPLNSGTQYDDFNTFLVYSICLFYIGDIHSKLQNRMFYIIYFFSIPVISLISNIQFIQHMTLNSDSIANFNYKNWLFILIISATILLLLLYHIILSVTVISTQEVDAVTDAVISTQDADAVIGTQEAEIDTVTVISTQEQSLSPYINQYVIYLICTLTYFLSGGVIVVKLSESNSVHIHHWFFFWLLSCASGFNNYTSISLQSLCFAGFTQGSSIYGIGNVFG